MAPRKHSTFIQAERFLNRFTNYEKLSTLKLKGSDLGRMSSLLKLLGNPQDKIRSVHVTGSKGKGTFCMLLESLLKGEGFKTSAFLSPHLESVTERIRLNCRQLSKKTFAESLFKIKDAIEALPAPPTYFEILTALAWQVFKDSKVDIAIIEAGIGGRFDATSIQNPCLSVITSIEKEHTTILGHTEAEILCQKLGIARSGIPLLAGHLKPALRIITKKEAAKAGADLVLWDESIRLKYSAGKARASFLSPFKRAEITFRANNKPFAINSALAAAACQLLSPGSKPLKDPAAIFESSHLPGRKEIFKGRPVFVIDAAHTFQSLRSLRDMLKENFKDKKKAVIFGVARDKDVKRLLKLVESFASSIVFVLADPLRGKPAGELLAISSHKNKKAAKDIVHAMRLAKKSAGPGGVVCVCGSFYTAGRARKLLCSCRRKESFTQEKSFVNTR